MIDLLVAGGGPAGLATALYGVRAGLSVTVLEPRQAAIDKACGEGLMPGAVAALRGLGVDLDGHELQGIEYLDGVRTARADFRAGPGLGVRRTTLHQALRDAAEDAGVRFVTGRVDSVSQTADEVTAGGITAGWLAAADGLHSPIRRRLGLEQTDRRRARYGLRAHFLTAPWSGHVQVHWSPHSEAYVTPVGPDLVGVAILSTRRATYDEHLTAFPALAARLAGAVRGSTVRGAGPLRQRVRARTSGRVLLVGDAAGYVDALTGEGIAMACAEAEALVGAIAADRPEDYERAWTRATRSYRLLTEGLLWTRNRRLLAPLIVPAAAALPAVFGVAVQQLASPHGHDQRTAASSLYTDRPSDR